MTFALPRLGHLVRGLSLGEPSMGRCLACGANVHPMSAGRSCTATSSTSPARATFAPGFA